jgi:hypothetical protein
MLPMDLTLSSHATTYRCTVSGLQLNRNSKYPQMADYDQIRLLRGLETSPTGAYIGYRREAANLEDESSS